MHDIDVYFFFWSIIRVLLMIKEQCVYDCKLTALKQIQSNHKESLIEIRNSDKERQCVRPQIRDHSNKVLASRFFYRSIGLSMSSKVRALGSFHTNHIRHAGIIFQKFEE